MSRATNGRAHLSIGEVLSLLQDEFPDVTISKIRFLESQGLLDPERTPSGYRKFYDDDIQRLRWILRQQKDHYLPLKVIKDRLDEATDGLPLDDDEVAPSEPEFEPEPELEADTETAEVAAPNNSRAAVAVTERVEARQMTMVSPEPAPETHSGVGVSGASSATHPTTQRPSPPVVPQPSKPRTIVGGEASVSLSVEELAEASGLSVRDIRDLERFGLIEGREGEVESYDGDALIVARTAAGFLQHGIEARHMRTYKVAIDREAGLFSQIVSPVLKQRNPEARTRASRTVTELMRLGEVMRSVLLRRELRDHLGPG